MVEEERLGLGLEIWVRCTRVKGREQGIPGQG